MRAGEHGMSVKKACGALGVSRGRYPAGDPGSTGGAERPRTKEPMS